MYVNGGNFTRKWTILDKIILFRQVGGGGRGGRVLNSHQEMVN